jgi:hypothetical protein
MGYRLLAHLKKVTMYGLFEPEAFRDFIVGLIPRSAHRLLFEYLERLTCDMASQECPECRGLGMTGYESYDSYYGGYEGVESICDRCWGCGGTSMSSDFLISIRYFLGYY